MAAVPPSRHAIPSRAPAWVRVAGVVVSLGLVGAVLVVLASSDDAPPAAGTAAQDGTGTRSSACELPRRELMRVWEGTKLPASGEIQIVAAEPDYVGGGLSHAGPWNYVQ